MEYNVKKLFRELIKAGINTGGCNASGIVWDSDGVTEIQDDPAVVAIIAAHDPTDYVQGLIYSKIAGSSGKNWQTVKDDMLLILLLESGLVYEDENVI